MSEAIKVTVHVDEKHIQDKLEHTLGDKSMMIQIHNLLAQMCDPYVPMDEGVLTQSTIITPEYVQYIQPYAHYQYTGDVYGPNIPIIEDGRIIGWFSPPGQKKHPTGKSIVYSTEKHPLASKQWDKAMLRDRGDEFIERVKEIIVRRFNELYG